VLGLNIIEVLPQIVLEYYLDLLDLETKDMSTTRLAKIFYLSILILIPSYAGSDVVLYNDFELEDEVFLFSLQDNFEISQLSTHILSTVVSTSGELFLLSPEMYDDQHGTMVYKLKKAQNDVVSKEILVFIETVPIADIVSHKEGQYLLSGYLNETPYAAVFDASTRKLDKLKVIANSNTISTIND